MSRLARLFPMENLVLGRVVGFCFADAVFFGEETTALTRLLCEVNVFYFLTDLAVRASYDTEDIDPLLMCVGVAGFNLKL